MAVHERLKQIRLEHNLSQSDFAQLASVSQPTIANWENGSHIPRRDKLEHLAQHLGFDLLWLLSGDGDAERRMATPYLMQPIHHIPIYDWPDEAQTVDSLKPTGFIPFAARKQPLFALRRPQPKSGRDRFWIIDNPDNAAPQQPHLIRRDRAYHVVPDQASAGSDPIIGPVLASVFLYAPLDQGYDITS